jgi:hypothetical protein
MSFESSFDSTLRCDYRHVTDEADIDDTAAWGLVGESGDYYVCDHHFQRRTDEGKRGWWRIDNA